METMRARRGAENTHAASSGDTDRVRLKSHTRIEDEPTRDRASAIAHRHRAYARTQRGPAGDL